MPADTYTVLYQDCDQSNFSHNLVATYYPGTTDRTAAGLITVSDPSLVVTVGGAQAVGWTPVSDTELWATVPAGSAGAQDIVVTTGGGSSPTSSADQYTYYPRPSVSSVSPTTMTAATGGSLTITGSGFTGATTVQVGGNSVSFVVNSDSSITATVPAALASAGTYDVTVGNPVGGLAGTSPASPSDLLQLT